MTFFFCIFLLLFLFLFFCLSRSSFIFIFWIYCFINGRNYFVDVSSFAKVCNFRESGNNEITLYYSCSFLPLFVVSISLKLCYDFVCFLFYSVAVVLVVSDQMERKELAHNFFFYFSLFSFSFFFSSISHPEIYSS